MAASEVTYLATERLRLRRFTAADVGHLVELDGDPQVMRFLSGGRPTPRAAVEHEILPRFLSYYDQGGAFGYWAAVLRRSGEFIGWFGLHPSDAGTLSDLVLGYRLRRSSWGQGYATEGVRALVQKAFAELGAERVSATTYEQNLASRRVLEKAGLRLVRAFRMTFEDLLAERNFDAMPQDLWDGLDLEFALERTEWEQPEPRREQANGRGTQA